MNFIKAVLFEDEFEPIPAEEEEKREVVGEEKAAEGSPLEESGSPDPEEAGPEEGMASNVASKPTESTETGDAADAEAGQLKSATSEAAPDDGEGEQDVGDEEGGSKEEVDEEEDGVVDLSAIRASLTNLTSGWNFGSIIQTIATKSEEVLKEYTEELQEFGRELQKETEELVETTTHTMKELPQSLESGAQAAQTSLEGVGQQIEVFRTSIWKGTTDIIQQVQEAIAAVDEEALLNAKGGRAGATSGFTASIHRGKYSRYEAQVSAMQRDSSTYCDEPEDTEEFAKWCDEFKLEERAEDIEAILKDNAFMQELQSRIVPLIVEKEMFWTRYFYRLQKLQQAEDARADLVKRATTGEDEDLSWDVDDDSEQNTPAAQESAPKLPEPPVPEEAEKEASDVDEAFDAAVGDAVPTAGSGDEGGQENSSSSCSSEWQVVNKEEGGGAAPAASVKEGDVAPFTEAERLEGPEDVLAAAKVEEDSITVQVQVPGDEDEVTAEDFEADASTPKESAAGGDKEGTKSKPTRPLADEELDEDWGEWE